VAKRSRTPLPERWGERAQIRYRRVVRHVRHRATRPLRSSPSTRGARIAETVALDLDDLRLSARKGHPADLRTGQRVREVPIHPQLRKTLTDWLGERPDWPGANDSPEPARQALERQGPTT
jgi:site-specific recombinase XerC